MSGAHEHPDMAAVVAGLLERVDALETALAGKVRGHREYTGKVDDRVEFPVDGDWHDIPGLPPFDGADFDVPDETHSLYVRVYPTWPNDVAAPLTIEARYLRATGDATGHDMKQYAAGTNSIPFRPSMHDEYGERGVGGLYQLRMSGGPSKVELTTRYGKARMFDVDWV